MGDKLSKSSWANERLPEMLWAALLVGALERSRALEILRSVGYEGKRVQDEARAHDITFTGIIELPGDNPRHFVDLICADRDAREALSPLLLLDGLPGAEMWREALSDVQGIADWRPLMRAVGITLWHQSQEATDCRWVRVLFPLACGKVFFVEKTAHQGREIREYPHHGDQTKVRPMIRASEIAPKGPTPFATDWAERFWEQCLRSTPCLSPGGSYKGPETPALGTTWQQANELYDLVAAHAHATRSTTRVDARHDTVFGSALYALSIVTSRTHDPGILTPLIPVPGAVFNS